MKCCALCGLDRPLQNSHIIPEFFYQPLYDGIHRFHVISSDIKEKDYYEQQGFREPLLCSDCECKFSKWELYAKEIIFDDKAQVTKTSAKVLNISGIYYAVFKLFLMSLLWRMGISSLGFFDEVELGLHESRLRKALLESDPLNEDDYPCFMGGVMLEGCFHQDWILPPSKAKLEGHHVYRVVISGFLSNFFVSSHAAPAKLHPFFLKKDGTFSILIDEARNMKFVAEHLKQIILGREGKV